MPRRRQNGDGNGLGHSKRDILILMDDRPIRTLLKFSKHDYIEDFVRGNLYMNTLAYFAKLEEEEAEDRRGDSFEGVGQLLPWDGGILGFKLPGAAEFQSYMHVKGPAKWTPTEGINPNVFGMYALRGQDGPIIVDDKNSVSVARSPLYVIWRNSCVA
jgi:hypothetical protein